MSNRCWSSRICARAQTYAELGAGYGIGTTTVFRYIHQAIEVLASLAPTLNAAMRRERRVLLRIALDRAGPDRAG